MKKVLTDAILYINIPIPSSILGYFIYSVIIIASMQLITYLINKLSITISYSLNIGIVIYVIYLTWKYLKFFEALKATAIFLVLLIIIKIVFSNKGSTGVIINTVYKGEDNNIPGMSIPEGSTGNYVWIKTNPRKDELRRDGFSVASSAQKMECELCGIKASFEISGGYVLFGNKYKVKGVFFYAAESYEFSPYCYDIEEVKKGIEYVVESFKDKPRWDVSAYKIADKIHEYFDQRYDLWGNAKEN